MRPHSVLAAFVLALAAAACAVDDAGAMWCWGYNEFGTLGNNSFDAMSHPTPGEVDGGHVWLH